MQVAKVISPYVAPVKHEFFHGRKLLVVKELGPQGKLGKKPMIAIDFVNAGVGEIVLIQKNGNSMDVLTGQKQVPGNVAIIGIVDHATGIVE